MQALARVGIAEHALKRGAELSGGQQQRAAIARTLVQEAELLIADEPIASLDPRSARRVMDVLADLNRRDGITVLVSLHQVEYALRYCPRTIALKSGEIVYDGPSCELTPELLGTIYGAEHEDLFGSTPDGAPHLDAHVESQGFNPIAAAPRAATVPFAAPIAGRTSVAEERLRA
jgi:phosphonate transport system ATP-binding protein